METFIKYLKLHLEKSRIFNHIKNIDDFVNYSDGYINVDLSLLDQEYYSKHVLGKGRKYAQIFMEFSIRAMTFQDDVTIFKFCFNEFGKLYLEYDINEYRRLFIDRILITYPTWKAELKQNNEIDLIVDVEINIADKTEFNKLLRPILHEMNLYIFKAPTTSFNIYYKTLSVIPDHKLYFN